MRRIPFIGLLLMLVSGACLGASVMYWIARTGNRDLENGFLLVLGGLTATSAAWLWWSDR